MMDEEFDLKHLECGSLKRQKHFLIKPCLLSCGHYMCFKCIEKEKNEGNSVKCGVCEAEKIANLEGNYASMMVNLVIKAHVQKLFDVVNDRCTSGINEMKTLFSEKREKIEIEYQYLKEEIEIRAESLKNEIDELCKKIYEDLDARKSLIINEIEPLHSDFVSCEKEIEKSKEDVKVINDMTKSIELMQEKLDYLCTLKQTIDNDQEMIVISETSRCIDLEFFGYFMYDDKEYYEDVTIPFRFMKKIDININVDGFCVLSNTKFIIADYESWAVYLYNSQIEQIKIIEEIDEHSFKPYSIATNGTDRIYINCDLNRKVLMTDFDFKLINTYESAELIYPSGLCFANNLLYVSDSRGKRIHIFKPDLAYESSIALDNEPWYIQVINNIACIRHSNELCISFYKLPEFSLKYRYETHNGSICIVDGKFYEFYQPTSTMYCYNGDGTMSNKEEVQFPDDIKLTVYSEIVYFKNRFIISSNISKCLIMPDSDEEEDYDDSDSDSDDSEEENLE